MSAQSSRSLVRHPGRILQPARIKEEIATGKFVNFPNLLGVVRLLLLFPLSVSLYAQSRVALLYGAAAYLLDALDGLAARRLKQETLVGKLWDGFLDKTSLGLVLMLSLLIGILPRWAFVIILSYHLSMIAGTCLLFYKGWRQPDGRPWGALANLLLGAAILLLFLGYSQAGQHVLLASLATSALLLGDYIGQILRARRRQKNKPTVSCSKDANS